ASDNTQKSHVDHSISPRPNPSGQRVHMGQFSVKIWGSTGSLLSGNQQAGTPTGSLKALPRCPAHLDEAARNEWRRLARPVHDAGVLTVADRAALAAYCQAYARWVEAVEKLKTTPMLLKTPSGYAQQSPWLSIANKQLELMGRYMSELGLTPAARRRLDLPETGMAEPIMKIELVPLSPDRDDEQGAKPIGLPETG
ncbi:MAG: phage terminase small subunit P27 family, partial [Henriciella sp.]